MVIENNNLQWGPGGTVGWLRKDFPSQRPPSLSLSPSLFIRQQKQQPLVQQALRFPNNPKLHFKVSVEVN